jgi:hypothetical protein
MYPRIIAIKEFILKSWFHFHNLLPNLHIDIT